MEVGGGPGFLKEMLPGVISTDVVWCPWLDAITDAQQLSFKTSSVTNIVGLDILHHLVAPMAFLKEAGRILVPGGRLILIEPWITPFSNLVYRYLHQEDCDLRVRPQEGNAIRSENGKRPFDGNSAIPYLLFSRDALAKTLTSLSCFKPLVLEPFCLFAYLLSFGFKPINLLPEFLYSIVATLERATVPLWRPLAALRMLIVLEKSAET